MIYFGTSLVFKAIILVTVVLPWNIKIKYNLNLDDEELALD